MCVCHSPTDFIQLSVDNLVGVDFTVATVIPRWLPGNHKRARTCSPNSDILRWIVAVSFWNGRKLIN